MFKKYRMLWFRQFLYEHGTGYPIPNCVPRHIEKSRIEMCLLYSYKSLMKVLFSQFIYDKMMNIGYGRSVLFRYGERVNKFVPS